MNAREFDLFVVGGGSGGVRAARTAAKTGAKVALAEKGALGGTCVNVGCVPKKLFVYAAGFAEEAALAKTYGWRNADIGALDWNTLRENKNREIARLNNVYAKLLADAGVEVINAEASLAGVNAVRAGGDEYRAGRILLACGGMPAAADIAGAELAALSDDMFFLPQLPERAAVIGGGYIAAEFAGILAGLGVETTLCYRADLPLRGFDDDLRRHLAQETPKHGVNIRAAAAPSAIVKDGAGLRVVFAGGGELAADLALMATGRKPATASLNLQAAGIKTRANGTLQVDDDFATSQKNIHAIGDILQTPALTPVATAEAEVFVKRVFGGGGAVMDYENIATAVFSSPPLATVGLTEEKARNAGYEIQTYRSEFRPLKDSLGENGGLSMMKLVVDKTSGKVLGVHIAGKDCAEMIQGFAVALKLGATKADLDATIGVHPTSAEELVTMK